MKNLIWILLTAAIFAHAATVSGAGAAIKMATALNLPLAGAAAVGAPPGTPGKPSPASWAAAVGAPPGTPDKPSPASWAGAAAIGTPPGKSEDPSPGSVAGAPVRDVTLPFAAIAPPPGTMTLRGIQPNGQVEFGVRGDEVVTQALLNLQYTPSPSLIPAQSHLKIYLNDQLMAVEAFGQQQLGRENQLQVPIDPRYITDFNRIRLEFIGHYQNICENPANTTLWLEIGKGSSLALRYQKLPLTDDLSRFPMPFFDARDTGPLTLPMVFAAAPDAGQQQAAAILASWFGVRAQWRGQTFPVLYNQLPDRHAVVFATNAGRPDVLRDMPPATGPAVAMVSPRNNPFIKLLLITGRDDADLLTAVKGIAQGNMLFRGQKVSVDTVEQLQPRQPYDAPNWVRTDRPMNFGELKQYPEQLQADGIVPNPISLNINLPPDLFLINSQGIDMRLRYRYTSPQVKNTSRLSVSLNNQFVQEFILLPGHDDGPQLLHLSLLRGLLADHRDLMIPTLKLGAVNQIRFAFDYTSLLAGGAEGRCETYTTVPNHVVIDDSSTIDFSGYRHFMAMPDLRAFANAGFPFSRQADLSQTLVLSPPQPRPVQLTTLLNTLGNIGALTGYPALGMRLSEDVSQLRTIDADILLLGDLPGALQNDGMRDGAKAQLLLDAARDWINQPVRQAALPDNTTPDADALADTSTQITAQGSIAALVGLQSPYFNQRSIVALLAKGPDGNALINGAMADNLQKARVFGSVALIRDSGVNSLKVGDTYYVGHLPWWERVWNALAHHPVILAMMAVIAVVLAAIVLWCGLRALSRRRLSSGDRE